HRLSDSLQEAASTLGARRACVARELTKVHEEAVRGTLPEIAALFRKRGVRGEVTVVVEGAARASLPSVSLSDLDGEIVAALAAGQNKRDLARELAQRSGQPTREIYARAVALSRDLPSGPRRLPIPSFACGIS